MAKVFSRMYIGDGFPANPDLPKYTFPKITIGANSFRVVRVPLCSEGRLTKLYVKQTVGAATAFVVQLLHSKAAYAGLFDVDIVHPPAPVIDPELVEVLNELNGAAGVPVEIQGEEIGFPFINTDGSSTNNQQFLYLVIIPNAGGPLTSWEVAITISRDAGH
jgi:hypothetical protein